MNKHIIPAAILLACCPMQAAANERAIALDPSALDLGTARSYEQRQVSGRQALCLDGVALLRGVTLRDGAVMVDIAATDERQFANLVFRARDAANYEDAYLRLHKSRQPDAVQYNPAIGGETNWQLFPHYQATADFGDREWVTMRIDFAGDRAQVTVDGVRQTILTVDDLVLDGSGQRLGIASLGGACFSNLRVAPDARFMGTPASEAIAMPEGTIRAFALSPSAEFEGFAETPPTVDSSWSVAEAEREGILLISRYRQKAVSGSFERNSTDVVHAGATLRSPRAQTVPLEFDASDRTRIYLNGTPLAELDNTFRAKGALFRGDFGPERQRVFLPLRAGDNELVFSVAERANGWGLAARLVDAADVTVRPLGW